MDYTQIIKEIGRGKDGAGDLDQAVAYELYGNMLDGKVPDFELGAILVAFRIKAESEAEMQGFYQAMDERVMKLQAPAGKSLPVVISTYNGARRQANLTPLLALLLAREGIPVLVHGVTSDLKRVTSAEVFKELGIPWTTTASEAEQRMNEGLPVFMPISALSPQLDYLLNLRWRLGVRNSTHTLAKLADPFSGQSFRIVSVTHPDYISRMGAFFINSGTKGMLLRGTEGEVYANPKRVPRMEIFADGMLQSVVEAEEGSVASIPELPAAMDAVTTARWIEQAIAGEVAIPEPLLRQVARCKSGVGLSLL
ncbi:MAG: DNA-binding protein YbiB [Methylophilales bacterium]|nr:DNA-binding protein YbiB [Methylophilales bacterium]